MHLLRNRGFMLLLVGQLLSTLAPWAQRIAVLIWVYALTHSGVALSLVGLAEALPLLLLAPVAGVFVDRWSRARTMAGAVVVQAVSLLPLLWVHDRGGVPIILAVTLLVNAAAQFSMPAAAAALPVVVGQDQVGQANSLLQLSSSVVLVIAPGLAALLYAVIGPHALMLVLIGVYLLAVPPLALVPAPRPIEGRMGDATFLAEMQAGLRYVRRFSLLVSLIVVAFVALLGAGVMNVLDVVFVTRALHLKSETVGVLFTATGVGQLVGGMAIWLLARWAARRYHLLLGVSIIVNGLCCLTYALAPSLVVAAGALFLGGAFFPPILVSFMTMIQISTEDTFMGRVMSLVNTSMAVAMIISMASGGVLTDLFGVRQVLATCSLIWCVSGVVSLALIRSTPRPRTDLLESAGARVPTDLPAA